ncbi:unnamed protein product [Symbiodinium sp. CCMP2592]|nr:unnamed protein product [Symbiodinium sp. CCMP2592]
MPDAWSTITRGDYANMFLAGLFDGHWCWRGGLAVRVSNLFDARCLFVPMSVKALRVTRAFELGAKCDTWGSGDLAMEARATLASHGRPEAAPTQPTIEQCTAWLWLGAVPAGLISGMKRCIEMPAVAALDMHVEEEQFVADDSIRTVHNIEVFLCWFIPSVVFAAASGLASSSLETYYPIIVYAAFTLLGLGYLLCLHVISLMLRRYLAGRTTVFPFWYIFLGVALSVALVLSVCFARLNYSKNMLASETLHRLAMASNVDPATDSSSRYLDIGRVEFAPGAQIDVGKYIGFKNSDLYCVAPITNKNATKAPASYDYWAVGLNCCDQNGFRCGEYDKPSARSGVRLLNEEQRQFYVLAVKEAEATFGITATTPLFFFWVEDANALQKSWKDKAMQYWLLACLTFTAFMFVATVAGVVYFESFYVTFW